MAEAQQIKKAEGQRRVFTAARALREAADETRRAAALKNRPVDISKGGPK